MTPTKNAGWGFMVGRIQSVVRSDARPRIPAYSKSRLPAAFRRSLKGQLPGGSLLVSAAGLCPVPPPVTNFLPISRGIALLAQPPRITTAAAAVAVYALPQPRPNIFGTRWYGNQRGWGVERYRKKTFVGSAKDHDLRLRYLHSPLFHWFPLFPWENYPVAGASKPVR